MTDAAAVNLVDSNLDTTGIGGVGIDVDGGESLTLTGTTVTNQDGNGITVTTLTSALVIDANSEVSATGGAGVLVDDDTDVNIAGTVTDNANVGVELLNATRVDIAGAVTDNGGIGVDITSADAVDISGTISDNGGIGVNLADAAGITISGDISDNDGIGVDLGDTDAVDITDATVDQNTGDGVNVNADTGAVTLTGATVSQNDDGVDATAATANVTVEDQTTIDNNGGVGLSVDNTGVTLAVTNSTVSNSGGNGVAISAADPATSLTSSEFRGNGVDLAISAADASDFEIKGNSFDSNEAITLADGLEVDGTLNFYGNARGPEAASGASVDSEVVYDPFISEESVAGIGAGDVSDTTGFGHDVVIQPDTFTSVGFPATAADEDITIGDHLPETLDGSVFVFNGERFERVTPTDTVDPFQPVVVNQQQSEPRPALIDYGEPGPTDIIVNSFEFQNGVNFVSPQQAGTVNEALFPGGDTDFVAQPFTTGDNLYGDEDATQSRDTFVNPTLTASATTSVVGLATAWFTHTLATS
jgi:hypothetical protein